MAEEVDFSAPVQAVSDPGATRFRIALLSFDWEHAHILIRLREWNGTDFASGKRVEAEYFGAVATNLMIALNKANLSTQSLHQRVIAKLLADGKIPSGTQTGTVD